MQQVKIGSIHFSLGFLGAVFVSALVLNAGAANPNRLKRADSFLGIHFDFHAGPDCKEIGKNTTRPMIENIIDQVHPDYLQIDCKGHRGLCSYPTKVGNPAPGFVGDPLRLWREVTAERGVSLYMHYSGVWDSEAIIQHPTWAVLNADGKTNPNATSFFGPYADKLLIPQLRELAGDYKVDGMWVDGECWASAPDYGAAALKAFRQTTDITDVPRKPSDPHWFEFLEFNRQAFRQYLRHYIAEVKKTNPDFQLCSNWAYTDHMPEAVNAPVDFLSGDYSPQDSVNSARLSARYLARQGKPWDLMAWSFTTVKGKDGGNRKTAVQLQREAAVVLALGGGFEAYFNQKRDGSIYSERMPVMGEVAKFCRARQAICHHATQVPQIALLYSTAAHYRNINGLFNRDLARINGVLQALLEGQQSVEVLGEHHLAGRLSEYPLIVIPEIEYVDLQFKTDLINYVKGGGNLLLIGPNTAVLFQEEIDVTFERELNNLYLLQGMSLYQSAFTRLKGAFSIVRLGTNAQPFGVSGDSRILWLADDSSSPHLSLSNHSSVSRISSEWKMLRFSDDSNAVRIPDFNVPRGSLEWPAASISSLDKGKIAATYFPFGKEYGATHDLVMRQFLYDLVRELFPKPMVEVQGSSDVDVVVNRINGKLAINLVNTSGPHQTEPILETISPVGPLTVIIRQPAKPAKVTLEPGAKPLAFNYASGQIQLTLPQLQIHDIIVVE